MYWFLKIPILYGILLSSINVSAQHVKSSKKMFRLYEDNDFINLRGKGTDESYTNGIRLDIFYEKNKGNHFFLNKLFPTAGTHAVNTYGWGVMQMMYTPRDISIAKPDANDFPYAGALFLTRSLHSANSEKRYILNTELQAGFVGPLSYAKETQIAVHKLINYQRPMGWDHQLLTKVILNVNISAEKQLWHHEKWFELIGGVGAIAGTLLNSISAHSLIRMGIMNPYFNGYIRQYSSLNDKAQGDNLRWQASVIIKPRVEYQFFNAITSKNNVGQIKNVASAEKEKAILSEAGKPNHYLAGIDYGMSLVCDHNSFAITQKVESSAIQGLRHHEVGNISYFKTW